MSGSIFDFFEKQKKLAAEKHGEEYVSPGTSTTTKVVEDPGQIHISDILKKNQNDSNTDSTPKEKKDVGSTEQSIPYHHDLHPVQIDGRGEPRLERIPACYKTPSDYDISLFKDFNITGIINAARYCQGARRASTQEERTQVRLGAIRRLWAGEALLGGIDVQDITDNAVRCQYMDPPPWVVDEVLREDSESTFSKTIHANSIEFAWPFPWAPGCLHEVSDVQYERLESLFARLGAKSAARDYLVSKFPEHHTYVEPFAGSFKVLLWKKDRSKIEIVNDVAHQMINFWRYVQCYPYELVDRINKMPVSEYLFFELQKHYDKLTPLMQAVAFYYTAKLTFNGVFSSRSGGMSVYATSPYTTPRHYIDLKDVLAVCNRLKYVDIRCNSFVDVIERANKRLSDDGKKIVFFYQDPPYYDTKGYRQIGDTSDMPFNLGHHHQLKTLCDEITKNGNKFMQTNSAHPMILDMYKDYHREIMKVSYTVSGTAEDRKETEEVIITNY